VRYGRAGAHPDAALSFAAKSSRISKTRIAKRRNTRSLAANKLAANKKEQGTKPCSKIKKSRARSPAPKIVSTLFPRKVGFDLD
jgi:hypothetical protein